MPVAGAAAALKAAKAAQDGAIIAVATMARPRGAARGEGRADVVARLGEDDGDQAQEPQQDEPSADRRLPLPAADLVP